MARRTNRRLSIAWLLLALAAPAWWFGGLWYSDWYEQTRPTAPLPERATLLARNPDDRGYWGSIARYWYYAKYSTPLPYAEVRDFYERRGNRASPFGGYDVTVLAPPSHPERISETADLQLSPALRWDPSDPPGETLIFVEVGWTPGDRTAFLPLFFCVAPIVWLGSLVILLRETVHYIERPWDGGRTQVGKEHMRDDASELRERLSHVYWVGGGSGAGKSTIARRVAEARGLQLYATDDVMGDHGRRLAPEQAPALRAFAAMDMDERWVSRSPRAMLETFHWFQGEGFELIVDDLLGMRGGPGVVAEGFRLLPRLVRPLLADPRRAVWLLPTPAFREAVFESRGGTGWAFIAKTGDPPRALANLLERDAMFTERLREEARELGLPTVEVDASLTADGLAARVLELFGL